MANEMILGKRPERWDTGQGEEWIAADGYWCVFEDAERIFTKLEGVIGHLKSRIVVERHDFKVLHQLARTVHSAMEDSCADDFSLEEIDYQRISEELAVYDARWPEAMVTALDELAETAVSERRFLVRYSEGGEVGEVVRADHLHAKLHELQCMCSVARGEEWRCETAGVSQSLIEASAGLLEGDGWRADFEDGWIEVRRA